MLNHTFEVSLKARQAFELLLYKFIVPEVCGHQAFPEASVVRHAEMQEFVDDDVFPNLPVQFQ